MALNFNPPEWIIQNYLSRPTPAEQANNTVGQALQTYAQMKQNEAAQKTKAVEAATGLFKAGGPALLQKLGGDYLKQAGLTVNDFNPAASAPTPPTVPTSTMTPVEMAQQQSIPSEHPAGISPIVQASISAGHGNPLGYQIPTSDQMSQWNQMGEYGQKQIGEAKTAMEMQKLNNELNPGPKKYVTRQQLEAQGNILQPGESLLPSENRDWNLSTDPTTGRRILVDKLTGEVKQVQGLGAGPAAEFTPNQLAVIDQAAKSYQGDDIVNGLRSNLSSLSNVRAVLNSDNPAALGPFRSLAARSIAGEKGVLTDSDVARNTGDQSLGARFGRYMKMATTGKMSQGDLKDFNNILDTIEKTSKGRLENVSMSYAKRASLRSGINDIDRIRQMIELPTNFDSGANPYAPKVGASDGKVRVSNGKETLLIDPSDLAEAQRDGYRSVQ